MRRRGGELGPRAPARVGEAGRLKARNHLIVSFPSLALTNRDSIPIQAQGSEILELTQLVLRPRSIRVEILDPDKKAPSCAASEQPRDQSSAQVA
jgi:hypothetical protein